MKPKRDLSYPRNPQFQNYNRKFRISLIKKNSIFKDHQIQNSKDKIKLRNEKDIISME